MNTFLLKKLFVYKYAACERFKNIAYNNNEEFTLSIQLNHRYQLLKCIDFY